jgi:O-antigen/teichoic acid export membrane protein
MLGTVVAPLYSIGAKYRGEQQKKFLGGSLLAQFLIVFLFVFFALLAHLSLSWFSLDLKLQSVASSYFYWMFATVSYLLQEYVRRLYYMLGRDQSAFKNDLFCYSGKLILVLCAFYADLGLPLIFLWLAITSLVPAIFGFGYLFRSHVLEFRCIFTRFFFSRSRQFSSWMALSSSVQWTSGNIIYFGVAYLFGTAEVGAIKAAQNIMGVAHVLFQAIENVVPPRIAGILFNSGMIPARAFLMRIGMVGVGCVVALSILIQVFSSEIVSAIYGDIDTDLIENLLFWFVVAYPFVFISVVLRIWCRTIERPQIIFYSYLLTTVFVALTIVVANMINGLNGIMFVFFVSHILMVGLLSLGIVKAGINR